MKRFPAQSTQNPEWRLHVGCQMLLAPAPVPANEPPCPTLSADLHLARSPPAFPGISPTAENPEPLLFQLLALCSLLPLQLGT